MKRKRLLSLLLAVSMILSLAAGCAKGEQNTPETESSVSTSAEDGSKEQEAEPAQEPTVLTFATIQQLQTEPVAWYETEVFQKIQEMANVKIEFQQYDAELFNLALASGDLPDLVAGNVAKIDDVVNSGMALDLAPLLEEYAPNMLLDMYAGTQEIVKTLKGGDENALYFVAPRIGVEQAGGGVEPLRGYVARWDYYLEAGAPEINSDSDFVALIEQMVAAHPETETGEKVYGIGLPDSLNYWYMRASFLKPTLGNIWTFSGSQYMSGFEDGELFNGYTDIERSAYWTDMKFYQELYQNGLLDPDSFTQTTDEYAAKVKAGRYVTAVLNEGSLYSTVKETDPETLSGFMTIPSSNALTFADKKVLTGYFPTCYVFVNAKSENWEAALRLLNVIHDPDTQRMLWCGIEGENWNYVDGVPTLTDEMLNMINNDKDALKKLGARLGVTAFLTTESSFIHPDGYPMDLLETDEMRASAMTPIQKSVAEHYDVMYPGQAATALVDSGETIDLRNDCGQLTRTAMPSMPTDISRILEKCNDILYRGIPNLVMAATDEEFANVQAQILSDLEAAGEPDAWEWCYENYNSAREIVLPIFESTNW